MSVRARSIQSYRFAKDAALGLPTSKLPADDYGDISHKLVFVQMSSNNFLSIRSDLCTAHDA